MREHAKEMADAIGPGVLLLEYGSGSSVKTRILLDHLVEVAGYVPIDISREQLLASASALNQAYPDLEVLPVCADFTQPITAPTPRRSPQRHAVYFPGSTIGNFTDDEARVLLGRFVELCGAAGVLLVGFDLRKDPKVIERAYNDELGITAEFNLNLLHRANRELGADFDVGSFRHLAYYDADAGRIELYLVSGRAQTVRIDGEVFSFDAEERILTEYSHKYDLDGFSDLAGSAGFELVQSWTDAELMFGMQLFNVPETASGPS